MKFSKELEVSIFKETTKRLADKSKNPESFIVEATVDEFFNELEIVGREKLKENLKR